MLKLLTALCLVLGALALQAEELNTTVVDISAEYGNIDTDIGYEQLMELGVDVGDKFTVKFGEHTITATFGSTYGDVPRGDWVGMVNSIGTLRIARNFENAAETIGVVVDDAIVIEVATAD